MPLTSRDRHDLEGATLRWISGCVGCSDPSVAAPRWVSSCVRCGYAGVLHSADRVCPECGFRHSSSLAVLQSIKPDTLRSTSGLVLVSCAGIVLIGFTTVLLVWLPVHGFGPLAYITPLVAVAAGTASIYGVSQLQRLIDRNEAPLGRANGTPKWRLGIVAWNVTLFAASINDVIHSITSDGIGSTGLLVTHFVLFAATFGVLRMHAVSLYALSTRLQTMGWQSSANRCRKYVHHGWWASGLLWILVNGGCIFGLFSIVWYATCLLWLIAGHVAMSLHAAKYARSHD